MPKVSVLVPIYNVEKYLEECLNSIVKQTLKDIEIICINDGSTDKSLRIIKRFAKEDKRIVILNKNNSGYGDSMNQGLQKARGTYIGIVESDDWIEKDAFEKLYSIATRHNAEVVKSNYYNYYTSAKYRRINGTKVELVNSYETNKIINPADTYHIFLQRPAIWTGIYKRSFLKQNNIKFLPTPGASYQDTGFNFKVWVSAKRAFFTDDAFLHYRQDNEASSVNSPGKVFCISDEFLEIEHYLRSKKLLNTKYGELMRLAKWGAYSWNIERLTANLAKEFITRASAEYRKDKESGLFNFEFCDANQVRSISELMYSPEKVIARKKAAEKSQVSVIVPVYNSEEYLRKCLDSILNQTLDDIEVIIVDDGSTDKSSDIAEEYFQKDSRVLLVNQYNHGQASARNKAIEMAHADYVAFSDSDDYYEPGALESLHRAITKYRTDIVVGSIRIIYNTHQLTAMEKSGDRLYYINKLTGKHDLTDDVLKKLDVSPCNKLFRKEIINEYIIRFPEGLRYEDAFFFHAYAWCSDTIFFLPADEYVYNYVRRPGSTMSQTFNRTSFAYDHIEIMFRLFEFLKRNDIFSVHALYFKEMFVQYAELALRYLPKDSRPLLFDKVREFDKHNGQYIEETNQSTRKAIRKYTEDTTLQKELAWKRLFKGALRAIKKPMKVAPRLFSPTYRNSQRILSDINQLHHKIDYLEKEQKELLEKLSSIQ